MVRATWFSQVFFYDMSLRTITITSSTHIWWSFDRYCLRHFINNFNDKFHNKQLKTLAYRAGSQNQVRKFNSIMDEIGQINPQARQWLQRHAFDRWTLAHDGGRRYGLLTTNLSKKFNKMKMSKKLSINNF